MAELQIGWAEVDTTPEGTIDLSGQYYHRLSRGVHSRLAATVLALEQDGEQAILISADLVAAEPAFVAELRARLRPQLPDLDPAKILLNATHTHSAPSIDPVTGIGWLQELPEALPAAEYRRFLLDRLQAAVADAWRGRQPGGVAPALSWARVGHCRRAAYRDGTAEMYGDTGRADFTGLEAGEDSGVDLLFTFDARRRPTGVILNLACPSQVMEATYLVSSDFIGETRRLLKQQYGTDFRVLAQISAAGCQSPRDLARNYRGEPDFWHADGVAEIGRRLLAAIAAVFPGPATTIDFAPILRHQVVQLPLPKRRASYADYVAAQERLAQLTAAMPEDAAYRDFCAEVERNEAVPGRPGPYDSKLHHFVLIQNNLAVIERYRTQDDAPAHPIETHVIRLGQTAIATNPFELYLEFGQRIKARSRAGQTLVVQLCPGGSGYLPSALAEQLGGYGGLIINGVVGADGGSKLVDETLNLITELFT